MAAALAYWRAPSRRCRTSGSSSTNATHCQDLLAHLWVGWVPGSRTESSLGLKGKKEISRNIQKHIIIKATDKNMWVVVPKKACWLAETRTDILPLKKDLVSNTALRLTRNECRAGLPMPKTTVLCLGSSSCFTNLWILFD